jgi:hypothetical protein
MAAPRNRRHILLAGQPSSEPFTTPWSGRAKPFRRPDDRFAHAAQLIAALTGAVDAARAPAPVPVEHPRRGVLVSFSSAPGVELNLKSLENKPAGIELRSVARVGEPDAIIETATVFIPEGQVGTFVRKFQQYAVENTAKGHPKHRDLVDRIQEIQLATLRALWTDDADRFPPDHALTWWEIWLRHDPAGAGPEVVRLEAYAALAGIALGRRLVFYDRTVCLARATAQQLAASVALLDDLAELRAAKTASAFFVDLTAAEQAEWANELLGRLTHPDANAPAVCVLDTGMTRAHPLIAPALSAEDATAVNPTWGAHDNGGGAQQAGHGTTMGGLALYGDLATMLESNHPVALRHRLESVKILPPVGENDPDLYGAITAQAASLPEIQAPGRRRVFSMAVTAPADGERGQPTSWSAAIDALAAGRSFDSTTAGLVYLDQADRDAHRLFVVAAGNVPEQALDADHLNVCDTRVVHDPAHAWNVLTVGACTDKAVMQDPQHLGWTPVANSGELSPWSSTGVTLSKRWPNKPDLVFEGGNVATDGQSFNGGVPDLCLLSTFHRPIEKLFVLANATSAATAQVARLAAIVSAEYPTLWPETIRALLVQAADWTPTMRAAIDGAGTKQQIGSLVRRYGFGVPSAHRALRSANDALTIVAQSTIHPYRNGRTREMHLYELPWPTQVLEELGEQQVTLRVTLSYFVEPNPARRGWRARHRYASHGLRFDAKTGEESLAQFRQRINKQAAREEEDSPTTRSDSGDWLLGPQFRHRGSLHSDIWRGDAVKLAARGVIAVYPVKGWWQEQPLRDRSEHGARYALVVSIVTDAENVDIWTPVAQQVSVPVEAVEIE